MQMSQPSETKPHLDRTRIDYTEKDGSIEDDSKFHSHTIEVKSNIVTELPGGTKNSDNYEVCEIGIKTDAGMFAWKPMVEDQGDGVDHSVTHLDTTAQKDIIDVPITNSIIGRCLSKDRSSHDIQQPEVCTTDHIAEIVSSTEDDLSLQPQPNCEDQEHVISSADAGATCDEEPCLNSASELQPQEPCLQSSVNGVTADTAILSKDKLDKWVNDMLQPESCSNSCHLTYGTLTNGNCSDCIPQCGEQLQMKEEKAGDSQTSDFYLTPVAVEDPPGLTSSPQEVEHETERRTLTKAEHFAMAHQLQGDGEMYCVKPDEKMEEGPINEANVFQVDLHSIVDQNNSYAIPEIQRGERPVNRSEVIETNISQQMFCVGSGGEIERKPDERHHGGQTCEAVPSPVAITDTSSQHVAMQDANDTSVVQSEDRSKDEAVTLLMEYEVSQSEQTDKEIVEQQQKMATAIKLSSFLGVGYANFVIKDAGTIFDLQLSDKAEKEIAVKKNVAVQENDVILSTLPAATSSDGDIVMNETMDATTKQEGDTLSVDEVDTVAVEQMESNEKISSTALSKVSGDEENTVAEDICGHITFSREQQCNINTSKNIHELDETVAMQDEITVSDDKLLEKQTIVSQEPTETMESESAGIALIPDSGSGYPTGHHTVLKTDAYEDPCVMHLKTHALQDTEVAYRSKTAENTSNPLVEKVKTDVINNNPSDGSTEPLLPLPLQEHSDDMQVISVNNNMHKINVHDGMLERRVHDNMHDGSVHDDMNDGSVHDDLHKGSVHDDLHKGSVHDDLHEGSVHDDLHEGSVHDNLHEGSVRDDLHEGSVRDDLHEGSVRDDLHERSVHGNLHEGSVRDDLHVGSVRDDLHEGSVRDNLHEGSVHDNLHEGSVHDNLHEGSVHDDLHEGSVHDDLHEGSVHDNLHEGSVHDNLHEGSVHDDLLEGSVCDDLHEGSVRDDLHDGSVRDDLHEGSVRENLHEGSVLDDLQEGNMLNRSVPNDMHERCLCNDMLERNVPNDSHNESVHDDIQKINVHDDMHDRSVCDDMFERYVHDNMHGGSVPGSVPDYKHERSVHDDMCEVSVHEKMHEESVHDDMLNERSIHDEMLERKVPGDMQERSVQDDTYERSFQDDIHERNADDKIYKRNVHDNMHEGSFKDNLCERNVHDDMHERSSHDDMYENERNCHQDRYTRIKSCIHSVACNSKLMVQFASPLASYIEYSNGESSCSSEDTQDAMETMLYLNNDSMYSEHDLTFSTVSKPWAFDNDQLGYDGHSVSDSCNITDFASDVDSKRKMAGYTRSSRDATETDIVSPLPVHDGILETERTLVHTECDEETCELHKCLSCETCHINTFSHRQNDAFEGVPQKHQEDTNAFESLNLNHVSDVEVSADNTIDQKPDSTNIEDVQEHCKIIEHSHTIRDNMKYCIDELLETVYRCVEKHEMSTFRAPEKFVKETDTTNTTQICDSNDDDASEDKVQQTGNKNLPAENDAEEETPSTETVKVIMCDDAGPVKQIVEEESASELPSDIADDKHSRAAIFSRECDKRKDTDISHDNDSPNKLQKLAVGHVGDVTCCHAKPPTKLQENDGQYRSWTQKEMTMVAEDQEVPTAETAHTSSPQLEESMYAGRHHI